MNILSNFIIYGIGLTSLQIGCYQFILNLSARAYPMHERGMSWGLYEVFVVFLFCIAIFIVNLFAFLIKYPPTTFILTVIISFFFVVLTVGPLEYRPNRTLFYILVGILFFISSNALAYSQSKRE